ncbi:hypothetical protein ACFQL1_05735 [Halomicroarcula sp. GCM10025709]|nr:hypothetical protein [Halomicroarcula sp. YJ-61-S]
MTHDTPNGAPDRRVWCRNCRLSVVPETPDGEPTCPACGGTLDALSTE